MSKMNTKRKLILATYMNTNIWLNCNECKKMGSYAYDERKHSFLEAFKKSGWIEIDLFMICPDCKPKPDKVYWP